MQQHALARRWRALFLAVSLVFGGPAALSAPLLAQGVGSNGRGPETGLPLPRYVSLKTTEGRARRGPARSHLVDWIFTRRDMPLRVTGEFEHWRRIEDSEGQGGWMHYTLLSGVRTALVTHDMAVMRGQPRANAPERAMLERGVVARILTCQPDWCRLAVEGQRGWVERRFLWGIDPHEWLD